jgi:hypothetical protein
MTKITEWYRSIEARCPGSLTRGYDALSAPDSTSSGQPAISPGYLLPTNHYPLPTTPSHHRPADEAYRFRAQGFCGALTRGFCDHAQDRFCIARADLYPAVVPVET